VGNLPAYSTTTFSTDCARPPCRPPCTTGYHLQAREHPRGSLGRVEAWGIRVPSGSKRLQRLPDCLGALASRSLDSTQVCGKSSGHWPRRLIAQEGSYRLEVGCQLRPWCVRGISSAAARSAISSNQASNV
jgi:hypothetical protein